MVASTARRGAVRRAALGITLIAGGVGLAACGTTPVRAAAGPLAPTTSVSASPSPSPSPSRGQPTTAASTPAAPRPPSRSPSPSTACRPANFASSPATAEGAMGSLYLTVVVTNHGPACTLNARPTLYYTRSGGGVARLPIARVNPGTKSGPLRVPHNRAIDMVVRIPNGYGGYAPTAPQCAHPATYDGISVSIGSGRLAVPDFRLVVKCEGVTLWQGWTVKS